MPKRYRKKTKREHDQSVLNVFKLVGAHKTKVKEIIEENGIETLDEMKDLVKNHRMRERADRELKRA